MEREHGRIKIINENKCSEKRERDYWCVYVFTGVVVVGENAYIILVSV